MCTRKDAYQMNRERRNRLQAILGQIEDLKCSVEDILSEEENVRDNIPENLWNSETYERSEAACDNLSEAVSSLDDTISTIEAAIE